VTGDLVRQWLERRRERQADVLEAIIGDRRGESAPSETDEAAQPQPQPRIPYASIDAGAHSSDAARDAPSLGAVIRGKARVLREREADSVNAAAFSERQRNRGNDRP
jgi:hypothetical protein